MAVRPPRYLRSIFLAIALLLFCTFLFLHSGSNRDVDSWQLSSKAQLNSLERQHYVDEKLSSGGGSSATTPDSSPNGDDDLQQPLIDKHGPAHLNRLPKPDEKSSISQHIDCPNYQSLQRLRQKPYSTGKRQFPYSRPSPECRTFNLTPLETLIVRMKNTIKDPDLYRLFENSYPNTLDTTIKWKGFAAKYDAEKNETTVTEEDLAFIITGDINAMWLRDSASQIYSYLPLLEASDKPDSLASLWRGLINSHARYIIISPYCHSFQPPPESGVPTQTNGAYHNNNPQPPYDPELVFDCKWELDSLASFLQVSVAYYQRTGDLKFFERWRWVEAVKQAVDAAGKMRVGTYGPDGKVLDSAWKFTGYTNRGSETLTNDGLGNPTKSNGMVRSAFRPSDDASIYQLLVPANMMFATYLESASLIMAKLHDARAANLSTTMREFAYGIRQGIDKDAIVPHKIFGNIFAYEVDGFGSANLMDDANIPSLLAMPMWNFTNPGVEFKVPPRTKNYHKIYNNTRNFVLSQSNPYWAQGPVLSAVGGPHLGPGKGWPMAAIVRAITAYSPLMRGRSKAQRDKEVKEQLGMLLDSTTGDGVMHESVNAWNEQEWTRSWFGWANGLLGELIMKIESETKKDGGNQKGILDESWQS